MNVSPFSRFLGFSCFDNAQLYIFAGDQVKVTVSEVVDGNSVLKTAGVTGLTGFRIG